MTDTHRPVTIYISAAADLMTERETLARMMATHTFATVADLNRQVRRLLIEHLLKDALRYALTPVEIEQLQALQGSDTTPSEAVGRGAEAGQSAVILSRERYRPNEGIILGD